MSSSIQSPTFSPPWLNRPYTGGYADRSSFDNLHGPVGLHSQMSDLSATSYSTRSTFSVPALPRNPQALTRAMERLSLSRRREFEAGRAARIAECYREKLIDIQRTKSGLQDWCLSQTRANNTSASVPPRVLHGSSTSELPRASSHSRSVLSRAQSHPIPKPAPARIDSSYLNSEADLTSLFLEVATEDISSRPAVKVKPSRQSTNVTLHAPECDNALTHISTDSPAETLARQETDATLFHSSPAKERTDKAAIGNVQELAYAQACGPEPASPRQDVQESVPAPSVVTPSATAGTSSAPSPPTAVSPSLPQDIDTGVLARLSTIFPYHTPEQLADALVEASGNEFGAIAVLLQGESQRRRGNTGGEASVIHGRGASVGYSRHGRALSTGTALSSGGGERLGFADRLKKKRKGLARRIKDLFRRTGR